MKYLESLPIKIISVIIIFFFSWTFSGFVDIAYAIDQKLKQSLNENKEPKKDKLGKKFEKTLNELEKIIKDVETDTLTKKNKVKGKKSEIESLNVEIKKQFADNEKKLKDEGLPYEILERHDNFVKHYEKNLKELQKNLDAIEKAKDKNETDDAIENTKKFLEKVKPPKKHVPLDPNKLPHRAPEPIFIEPRTSPEEFTENSEALAINSNVLKDLKSATRFTPNDSPILVASSGSLNGLLNSNTEYIIKNSILETQNYIQLAQASDPPTSDDLSETIEVQFTTKIMDLAEALGYNPVRIYQYVRNNFAYEPYYGSLKGAHQTFLEKAGNDFDQASLLNALLRASGIPARYVYGTVEIPIEDIKSWLGIDDTNMALTALASIGIPLTAIQAGGTVVAARLEHVWCQAYVPYVHSRGALEGSGDMWIDIDPSFKTINKEIAEIVDIPDFDSSQYLVDIKQEDPISKYEIDIQSYLDTIFVDRTVGAVKVQKEIEALQFEFLLGTLPYDVIASTSFANIPNSYRYEINFSVTDAELFGTPLTYDITTPELADKRVSLSYNPATEADTDLIDKYGGLYNVPAYLLHLKPEIRISGEIKASGSAIGFGKNQIFIINFKMPYGKSDYVENAVIAGGYYVPVMNLQTIPEHQVLVRTDKFKELDEILQSGESIPLDDYAGEILHLTGLAYFQKLNAASKNAEQLLKILDIKGISETIVSLDVSVEYVFGTPVSVNLSNLSTDVDRNIHLPIPIDGDMIKKKEFMILTGMTSSFFEHKTLEEIYEAESVSAVKIIQIANDRGIPVYTLNSGNILDYIDNVQVSSDVKIDVINAVNTGKEVIIPQQEMQINDWFGIGYIIRNPQTGAAAYMISGGIGGSALSATSVNTTTNLYSYQINPITLTSNINDALTPNYHVRFPGFDDEYFTFDDNIYFLIDIWFLPEEIRDDYFDPHPDRGDNGLILIDETNKNDWITSFLQLYEFQSKDLKPYMRLHPSLIFALQLIKQYTMADDIMINSGYRTRSHNTIYAGPFSLSSHMDGLAADIRISINGKESQNDSAVYQKLEEAALLVIGNHGGVGKYPSEGFVHVDTRGLRARW